MAPVLDSVVSVKELRENISIEVATLTYVGLTFLSFYSHVVQIVWSMSSELNFLSKVT